MQSLLPEQRPHTSSCSPGLPCNDSCALLLHCHALHTASRLRVTEFIQAHKIQVRVTGRLDYKKAVAIALMAAARSWSATAAWPRAAALALATEALVEQCCSAQAPCTLLCAAPTSADNMLCSWSSHQPSVPGMVSGQRRRSFMS